MSSSQYSSSNLPSSLQDLSPETLTRFREIVNVPPTFDTPKEQEACQEIVSQLSDEDIIDVAKISYAYWALTLLQDEAVVSNPEVAKSIAIKIAKWHLQYLGGKDIKGSVKRLQEAIQIRKDRKLELLRTCFDKKMIGNETETEAAVSSQDEQERQFQTYISNDIQKQLQFYRGQDLKGRAVLIKIPRMASGTTEVAYMTQQLYIAEKAAAVTEFISSGTCEKACAIFSMKNQNSSYTPSLSWQLSTIKLLQQLFPGRMGCVIILDAPFMIRGIFNSIKPFLSASLRDSTFMVAGKTANEKLVEVMGEEEANNILNDKGELVKPVDIEKYLFETPFYCPYEYEM